MRYGDVEHRTGHLSATFLDGFRRRNHSTEGEPVNSYEQREMMKANKYLADLSHMSLTDRQEARADYLDALATNLSRIYDDVNHLFDGNYGHGAQLLALDALERDGSNRLAAIAIMVAGFGYSCPAKFAIGAFAKLSKAQAKEANRVIAKCVNDWIEENGEYYEQAANAKLIPANAYERKYL